MAEWWEEDVAPDSPAPPPIPQQPAGDQWWQDDLAPRAPQPEPIEEGRLGRAVSFAGDLARQAGGAIGSGASALYETARGPEGLPDLPEFDQPAETFGQTARFAGGMLAAMTPEQEVDILKANYPDLNVEQVERDGRTFNIVRYKNPETGETQGAWLNQPGLSPLDIRRFLAQAATFGLTAGKGSAVSGILARMAGQGARAGATSVGLDLLAEEAGSQQGVSVPRALFAAGGAAVFEGLAPAAVTAWRRILGRSKNFNFKTGQLTDEGIDTARKAGLDPADMTQRMQRAFARNIDEAMDPQMAARIARTQEFDIPGTRGQITKDYRALNLEDRMRRGLEGDMPLNLIRAQDDLQRTRIGQAAERLQTGLTGRAVLAREAEPASILQEGLRQESARRLAQVDRAYTAFRAGEPAYIRKAASKTLRDMVDDRIADFDVTPELTPAATRALKHVDDLVDNPSPDLRAFERTRKMIGRNIGQATNPDDAASARAIKNTLDNWLDDALDQGLLDGDPSVLSQLKQARGLRAEYGRLFEKGLKKKPDVAGDIMQKIVTKAETPEQTVNFLFGRSALGQKKEAAIAAKRIKEIFGSDADEWNAVRELGFLRLTRDKAGNIVSPKKFAKAFDEAMMQDRSLMTELYSAPELRQMARFKKALMDIQADPTNPSGTAFGIENAFRYLLRRSGQRELFTQGNIVGGAALQAAARLPVGAIQGPAREMLARRAITQLPRPRPIAQGPAARAIRGGMAAGAARTE